jgi:2-polyprenyl-3-methyl-5-hydroxy-6-metoxy-1,4-benzoquinol methylase
METAQYRYDDSAATYSHSYVLPAIVRLLESKPGPILDLGCGNGSLANHLIDLGLDVYGVDASHSGIAAANSRRAGRFHVMDIGTQTLPEPLRNIPFSTVLSTEVIEHLYDPRGLLRLARSILGNVHGRRLVLSTPYHGYWKNLALALSGKMDRHFTAHWDGGHIKFFSRKTLEAMLREQGFEPKEFVGAGRFPFLWRSMVIAAEVK